MEVSMSMPQNPSPVSIHLIKKINKVYIFWKSGSLYVPILATLISIVITRILIAVLNHRRNQSAASSVSISNTLFDDDFSDIDEDDEFDANDDDSVSDSSSEDEEEETETRESDEELKSKLQRVFSWSDFARGKSVVKLWDGIGLGLDLNHSSGSLISIYDLDREQKITTIFDKCKFPSVVRPSPSSSVVISASRESFTAWDSRAGSMTPSIVAEWDEVGPPSEGSRAPVVVLRGVKKVYIGDRVSGAVAVADARKVGSPLATGRGVETWWGRGGRLRQIESTTRLWLLFGEVEMAGVQRSFQCIHSHL